MFKYNYMCRICKDPAFELHTKHRIEPGSPVFNPKRAFKSNGDRITEGESIECGSCGTNRFAPIGASPWNTKHTNFIGEF